MNKSVIVDTKPTVLDLEAGTYYWCTCGQSKGQPFCDGSHAGTDFTPEKVVLEKSQKVALCLCKHSKNGAFCDGSHAQL